MGNIYTQLEVGLNPAAIAMELNRSVSMQPWTISGGSRLPCRRNPYARPGLHRHSARCAPPATRNRVVGSGHPLHKDPLLARADWIAGTLALAHADTSSLQVSHETIYTAIYAMSCGKLRTAVIGWVRFGHA